MNQDSNWWDILKPGALVGTGPLLLGAWQWWWRRADRRAAAERDEEQRRKLDDMTAIQRQAEAIRADRAALTVDQREWVERLEADVVRERRMRLDTEQDRDRGWNLARHYYRMACDLEHAMNNARAAAEGLAARRDPPEPVKWRVAPSVPPNLEDAP